MRRQTADAVVKKKLKEENAYLKTQMVTMGNVPNSATLTPTTLQVEPPVPPPKSYAKLDDIRNDYGNKALFLTSLELEVAINSASGMLPHRIAELLGVDTKTVRIITNRRPVKEFIDDYVAEVTTARKANRIAKLAGIIDAKLEKITDLSEASDLDIAVLMNMLDNMQKEEEKVRLNQSNTNQVLDVLKAITK